MSKFIFTRVVGVVAAVTAFIILSTSRAFAEVDPGLGEGGGSAPPPSPAAAAPFEVFGMSWQAALALVVAVIAVVGLALSVQYRRHAAGRHA